LTAAVSTVLPPTMKIRLTRIIVAIHPTSAEELVTLK
jgi:hypothetical protein